MPISQSLPPRPTLLTTAVLAGTAQEEQRPASNKTAAGPRAMNATTPVFYILLSFIIASLVLGVFPQY